MDVNAISRIIKEIRKKNNLTQQALATKLGVTYQAVSKWETGKNIPDITILQMISKEFDIDINEMLVGKKRKSKNFFLIPISIFIVLIFFIIIHLLNHNDFNFKTITTDCKEFSITGSAAYSSNKTYIYISNINYCGEENNTVYKNLNCELYESTGNMNNKIYSCNITGENSTLSDFLKEVQIKVNDYSSVCKNISSSDLYLEISALDDKNKTTTYKIPISLKENCE